MHFGANAYIGHLRRSPGTQVRDPPTRPMPTLPCARRALLCLLAMSAFTSVLHAQGRITLQAGASATTQVAPSVKLAVPIVIDMSGATGGTNLAALTTTVTWGQARLSLDSVTAGSFGTLTSSLASAANGSTTLSLFNATGTTSGLTMATMYFTSSATSGGTRVLLSPSAAGDEGGASVLSLLLTRGQDVCVGPLGFWGDANGDNAVNVIDAQQIARFSVGLSVASGASIANFGDVNADANVNIIDAQQIARFSVGLSAAVRVSTTVGVAPVVSSVAITSGAPTITPGQSTPLTAVARDAGSVDLSGCAPITWSSSNPSTAVVNANGTVTGVSAGTVTVSASAGGHSAQVTVTILVQSAPSLAFQNVVQGGSLANLANVAGPIDVGLLVTGPAGTLRLIQNCAPNAPASSDVIVAQQSYGTVTIPSLVVLSFNTAATGSVVGGAAVTDTTSATPIFLNGNCTLKATFGAVSASYLPLTLNNPNIFRFAVALTGPSAVSAVNGQTYRSGDLTAVIAPVNYQSLPPLASISGSFAGGFPFSGVTPAAGTQTFTVVFSATVVASGQPHAASSIAQYTSPATGDVVTVTSSTIAGGVSALTSANPSATIRVDNAAPLAPASSFNNPSGGMIVTPTNFINPAYVFASGLGTSVDAAAVEGSGTGGVTAAVGYALSTQPSLPGNVNYGYLPTFGVGPTACSRAAFTIVTTGADVPRTMPVQGSSVYRARAFWTDKIGNVSCKDLVSAPGASRADGFFGVDTDIPTIAQTGGPDDHTIITTGTTDSFTFQDSTSGFVINAMVQYQVYRNFSTASTAANCVSYAGTAANGCRSLGGASVVIDNDRALQAYYTLVASSVDQAGNLSIPITRTYLLDNTAPLAGGISIPQFLVGGQPTSFSSSATDNVDLRSSSLEVTYSAASGGTTLYYAADTYGPNFDATRVTSTVINGAVPFFITQLQGTIGSGAPVAFTTADSGRAQTLTARAVDAANLVSVPSTATVPAANLTSAPGFTAGVDFSTIHEVNAPVALSNGAGTNARATTLAAALEFTSPNAQNAVVPAAQVCFYYRVSASANAAVPGMPVGDLVQVGCVSSPTITDIGGVSRTWTYTLPGFDPPAELGTVGPVLLYAIAMKANGVGIISQPNTNVTLVP
ncbi:MAG: Ig domain protein group 2 domain protein [Gemmatimonadetes bacterium]|nr:Ig domain protein group 2 domain protein [Gemmatimonadota bacterium]